MQSYRTCHASQITGIRVGTSIVTGPTKAIPGQTDSPNSNSLRSKVDHEQRVAAIRSDSNLSDADKQAKIDAENADFAGDNVAFTPPPGQMENTITDPVTGKTRTKSLDEIKSESLARDKLNEPAIAEGDENSDGIPDETQDIIHLVLTGGEKRSILRSDLTFAQSVVDRGQVNVFPGYAQRRPAALERAYQPIPQADKFGLVDQNSLNSPNTVNPQSPHVIRPNDRVDGAETADLFPLVGDWLVEDWDVFTDTYVQKIYDNATFGRYFKASLN